MLVVLLVVSSRSAASEQKPVVVVTGVLPAGSVGSVQLSVVSVRLVLAPAPAAAALTAPVGQLPGPAAPNW